MRRIKVISYILFSFLFLISIYSCKKGGKQKMYDLHMIFQTGDTLSGTWSDVSNEYAVKKISKPFKWQHRIILNYLDNNTITLYKTDNKKLIGFGQFAYSEGSNFSILNGLGNVLYGTMELYGDYERHLNSYSVNNGTFIFLLYGWKYNVPDTTYTGTWTMQRK